MTDAADALLGDFADDTPDTPAPPSSDDEHTTISIPAVTVGTLIRPKHTFEVLRDAAAGHWWVAALLGLTAAIVAAVVGVVNEQQVIYQALEQATGGEQLSVTRTGLILTSAIFGGIGAILALLIGGYLLRAGVAFGGGLVLGGKLSFKQAWRMAVWTTLPEVIGFVALALALVITGDAAAPGLSAALTAQEALEMPALAALLSAIDLYLIWGFVLLAVGTAVTARISAVKGVLIAAAYYAVVVLVPTGLAFASGLLTSGLTGA